MAVKRAQLAQNREAAGLSQEGLAEKIGVDRSTVVRWESGTTKPQPTLRHRLADAVGLTVGELAVLLEVGDPPEPVASDPGSVEESMERRQLLEGLTVLAATSPAAGAAEALESTRLEIRSALPGSDLDDWEQSLAEYGRAYLVTPPAVFASDLATDLVHFRRSVAGLKVQGPAYRQWCRTACRMSGLMAMSLGNLGHRSDAARWWRTARAAGDASGALETRLWVSGEWINRGLYDHQPPQLLLRRAEEAIGLAQGLDCYGLAQASAGRAQILALIEDFPSSRTEMSRTQRLLDRLPAEISGGQQSTFRWGEDRLRYTETWVHAHRGDQKGTDIAASRAKALYPAEDCRTPVQIELLQALARSRSGDLTEGVQRAHTAVAGLTRAHRTAMIEELAHSVLPPLSTGVQKRSDIRAYRELLAEE
jgi:transcriptional regulator with XRE-family HTH domain